MTILSLNPWAVLSTAAVVLGTAASAEAQVITLEMLRARALKARPELALQDARIASAEARVAEAQAPLRPRVSGRVDATASPGSELVTVQGIDPNEQFVVAGSKALDEGIDAFAPQLRYSARVGVEWNIWDFGRTSAAAQAARAERRARQAEAAQTREALVEAVDEVYLEWLGAHERARLETETIAALKRRIDDLQAKADAGGLAPSALLPIRADLAAAELRQAYAHGAVRLARLAVEDAVGGPLADDERPDPQLLTRGAQATTASSSTAVDRTDEALAARAEAARATARLHGKTHMPRLLASASAGIRGQFSTVFPFYAAVVGMEFPLYDGGAGTAKAAAARADARALELRRAQRQAQQRRTQTREMVMLDEARRRVDLAEALHRAAEARLTDAMQRYEESAAGPGELTQARAQRGRATAELLTAKLDRARAALVIARSPAP